MTTHPHGATSVVSIERRDNVVYLDFPTSSPPPGLDGDDSWWPWMAEAEADAAPGKTSAATRPIPARWSPRPCRVMADRFARYQLAADLRGYAWLIGLLCAVLVVCVLGATSSTP